MFLPIPTESHRRNTAEPRDSLDFNFQHTLPASLLEILRAQTHIADAVHSACENRPQFQIINKGYRT
ncbi:hypothetical protein HOLleu_41611 [Holothuria leucospilota]|uniref:Uncharacterized protein n=1 Tax=Holothuria leucospilota TaxID=206669 RepID=A0A9Q0YJC7_HOLLE|nr:hypothetical protein HOLleu_41611 [Holothuria leucospilota]